MYLQQQLNGTISSSSYYETNAKRIIVCLVVEVSTRLSISMTKSLLVCQIKKKKKNQKKEKKAKKNEKKKVRGSTETKSDDKRYKKPSLETN